MLAPEDTAWSAPSRGIRAHHAYKGVRRGPCTKMPFYARRAPLTGLRHLHSRTMGGGDARAQGACRPRARGVSHGDCLCSLLAFGGARRGGLSALFAQLQKETREYGRDADPLQPPQMVLVHQNRQQHREQFASDLDKHAPRTVIETSVRLPKRSSVSKIAIWPAAPAAAYISTSRSASG